MLQTLMKPLQTKNFFSMISIFLNSKAFKSLCLIGIQIILTLNLKEVFEEDVVCDFLVLTSILVSLTF